MAEREFSARKAVRERVPLLLALSGPSGSGKTYSALELATGMAEVEDGPIVGIDTENKRMLHYADMFDFHHIDFQPPFRSLDYLAAINAAAAMNPACVIIDSMSHEHEGAGGMIQFQAAECEKMVERAKSRGDKRQDWQIMETYNMLAWREPKAARAALLLGLMRLNINCILCFRAAEKTKPQKNGRKTEIVQQGFTPIGADKFIWETQLAALLYPGELGIPHWQSTMPGEKHNAKMAEHFQRMFRSGDQLNRSHGKLLAEWAKGGATPTKRPQGVDIEALRAEGQEAANRGTNTLQAFWKRVPKAAKKELKELLDNAWKPAAVAADIEIENEDQEGLDLD